MKGNSSREILVTCGGHEGVGPICGERTKRPKSLDLFGSAIRKRSVQVLIFITLLYVFLVSLEIPFVFTTDLTSIVSQESSFFGAHSNKNGYFNSKPVNVLASEENLEKKRAPFRPLNVPLRVTSRTQRRHQRRIKDIATTLSSLVFYGSDVNSTENYGFPGFLLLAKEAFDEGKKLWEEIEAREKEGGSVVVNRRNNESEAEDCPYSKSMSGSEFLERGMMMELPCGLTLGSHITVVGRPKKAHRENDTKITKLSEGEFVMVSQFVMELHGLKTVDGEDPPKILHFNPRLKGDYTWMPVIEQNTRYRMRWGTAQRCEGWQSGDDEETVDGQVKCEKWMRDGINDQSEESETNWWLNRLVGLGRTSEEVDWPFPFSEEKLFVLTLNAGLEGYHVNVDGRHVTSFPYRPGFALEDATGLSLSKDIDVHSVFAAFLPTSNPNYAPQRHLDMSTKWKAPPLPDGPTDLFIGVLSAGNHFAERMAVRMSWMQNRLITTSNVVARFFVALHEKMDINLELKKEADFFGDIVIVPYMDTYDLVVLKTVAICEYGVRKIAARNIMKCDDDTFVRVESIVKEANKVPDGTSFYIGNINYYHEPLRNGKWAVTYEEWQEDVYPPYANGPGYIISSDIAKFVVSEFDNHKLRLFKMEDVSMGVWVERFNSSRPVKYVHSLKFCQFGCIENYYTAHYQSPRQMLCMWNKVKERARQQCCNMR